MPVIVAMLMLATSLVPNAAATEEAGESDDLSDLILSSDEALVIEQDTLFEAATIKIFGSVLISPGADVEFVATESIEVHGSIRQGQWAESAESPVTTVELGKISVTGSDGKDAGTITLRSANSIHLAASSSIAMSSGTDGQNVSLVEIPSAAHPEIEVIGGDGGDGGNLVLDASVVVVQGDVFIGGGGHGGSTNVRSA